MNSLVQIADLRLPQVVPIELSVESIDVYLTFRCGLRCSHCFLGDNLSSKRDMELSSLTRLLKKAHAWNAKQVTFLGGEPTMHPDFDDALAIAEKEGYTSRVITNGHSSFSRFLKRGSSPRPLVCFSLDGSTAEVHDQVRGKGTHALLVENISRSIALGYRLAGILSVSRQNVSEVGDVLCLCDRMGFEYVNVHYVTNRGFAPAEIVLSVSEWERAYSAIRSTAAQLTRTEIRVEKTFEDSSAVHFRCAVKERKNLMFLPDGRVFMCMMFIDSPMAHSFVWTGHQLVLNNAPINEQRLVLGGGDAGCRGMKHVNSEVSNLALKQGKTVQCIYEKEHLFPGQIV